MTNEKPFHKDLSPLKMVDDDLSLDRDYGSFVQGQAFMDFENLIDKAESDEDNINVPVESESLKQFQFKSFVGENPISNYFFTLFVDIETHVNEFKGLMQWDVLVSYYIIFSINEVYCEILESHFLDDESRKKMKEEVNSKVTTFPQKSEEFKEYIKYFFLTFDIPKVKDSDLAKFSKRFVKEFLDTTLYVEKSIRGEETEPGTCIVMPDANSLNAYLDAWKISFKALAVSINKHFDTGNSLDFNQSRNFCNTLFDDLSNLLLPNLFKWYYLKDYKQEALEKILYEMGSERHYWRNDGILDGKEIIYGYVLTPPIPQEVIQLAEEFK